MYTFHEEYIVDQNGQKKSVVLPYKEWQKVVEDLEELEDIRQYDMAKTKASDAVSFDKAIKELIK